LDRSNAHVKNCTLILSVEAGLACTKKKQGAKKNPQPKLRVSNLNF